MKKLKLALELNLENNTYLFTINRAIVDLRNLKILPEQDSITLKWDVIKNNTLKNLSKKLNNHRRKKNVYSKYNTWSR